MKKKIFVADDDKDIIYVLTIMLEDAGYEVHSTALGLTAQMVSEYWPDLLLLDIWMAGVDGRDICKDLKSHTSSKRIPIILISAHKDIKKIAQESDADDFIAKPFDMYELLAKVAHYVK